MKTEISATAKITLKIGKHEIELSKEDAKKLLTQLQDLVGDPAPVTQIKYIHNERPPWMLPVCTPPYPEPYQPPATWADRPTLICQASAS